MMRAQEIHARIGASWPTVLEQLGVPGLGTKKPRPCPLCGGRDRFIGDNRTGRGDYFCRHCGAGDGFGLLMKANGWTFSEARQRVMQAAGLADDDEAPGREHAPIRPIEPEPDAPARPTDRVRRLMRESCAVEDCADAVAYLKRRSLWPLPGRHGLRAHMSVEYWHDHRRVGSYAALVAPVRDIGGDLVSVHVTYLRDGRKLAEFEPRKIMSPLTGRIGCAVRLTEAAGETIGIAEGIETALAAAALHGVPTWSALNAGLLAKFEPPTRINRLVIFADRDAAGLEAAGRLMEKLQGRVTLELRPPAAPAKDWNDRLMTERAA